MSNDKKVIEKLLKIAENQQKIITKLAQMGATPATPAAAGASSWLDVTHDVAAKLAAIPGAKGYSVNSAELGGESGSLRGKLVYPANATNYYDVLNALKNQLVGKSVKTSDGKDAVVSSNPKDVSFIGMS